MWRDLSPAVGRGRAEIDPVLVICEKERLLPVETMKYKNELAALQVYIDNFDPEEFTTSGQFDISGPTPEKLADIQKLKAKLKRNRQIAESFQSLFANGKGHPEMIITQEDVDALLEGWKAESS